MITVHAEIHSDGTRLILFADGPMHEMAPLQALITQTTPLWSVTDPPGGLIGPLTWSAVVQLSATLGRHWQPGPRLCEWIERQLTARAALEQPASPLRVETSLPPGLVPRDYQRVGARMLASTRRGMLFDDPGTGKTITTILGLLEGSAPPPILVIAPASVVDPWVEAFRAWAPQWRTTAWRGAARKNIHTPSWDVYVTSYDTAARDWKPGPNPGRAFDPRVVVVDECHMIKNMRTRRSVAARKLGARAEWFVALSGTPISHHPGDLWPSLYALDPLAHPSSDRWKRRYCLYQGDDYESKILGLLPDREPEFRSTLLGQTRRVSKADVLTELPPKIHVTRKVELPPKAYKAYRDFETSQYAEMDDGTELSAVEASTKALRLCQLANAAGTVTESEDYDDEGNLRVHVHVTPKLPSWKIDELIDILDERAGQQVLVFAPAAFTKLLMLAGEVAEKAGYRVGYITGKVTGSKRTRTVEAFQAGALDVLFLNTQAGGVGLTLTAASTVVFIQRPWSIIEATQAEDRAHRIGSERHESIEIIDIVAQGTIDQRIRDILRTRAASLSELLQDPRIAREIFGGVQ